jgi:hypothetical protein
MLAAAGCGRVEFEPPAMLEFVDETKADFDGGGYDAGAAPLGFVDGRVRFSAAPPFDPAEAGIFVSRVFDTGGADMVWDSLAWTPIAPHGRPLPDGEGMDVGYAEDAIDMADNILLLHYEQPGGVAADGAAVTDSSGRGHDGRIVLAGQRATYVRGAFGQGLDIERDAWVSLDGGYFDYGTGDFTYAVWAKMYDCSQSNTHREVIGGAGSGDDPHMWLGSICPDPCPDNDSAFMNFLDDTRMGPSLEGCSGVVLQDGGWHLLAGVKQGHTAPPAVVRLYVDGREIDVDAYDFGTATFTYDGGEIRIGGFNLADPMYHTKVLVDETAIWKRALDADEIAGLYRRGVLALELQFRVCPDRTCDDELFVGPDGTSATYFTEADLAGPAGSQRGNLAALGLVGPTAQYRARFSTGDPALSPGLVRVMLQARRP